MKRIFGRHAQRITASLIIAAVLALSVGGGALVWAHEPDSSPSLRFISIRAQQHQTSLTATLALHNATNQPIDATAHIQVYDPLGIKVSSKEQSVAITPPETTVVLTTNAPFWGGLYKITSHAHYADPSIGENKSDDEASHAHTEGPEAWVAVSPQPLALAVYVVGIVCLLGGLSIWGVLAHQKRQKHKTVL